MFDEIWLVQADALTDKIHQECTNAPEVIRLSDQQNFLEKEVKKRMQNRDANGLFDDSDENDIEEESEEFEAAQKEDILEEIE